MFVAVLALLVWGLDDLYGVRKVDIRVFDAIEVARLDNAMWRSYYERKPLLMFVQLAELLRKQFQFPYLRSYATAARAARAAFVFKDGKTRADYEKALPDLQRYYGSIRAISETPFDVPRAAKLELEWWIVHRQRAKHLQGPGPKRAQYLEPELEHALALAAAELYRVPPGRLRTYAHDRGEAMSLRDTKAAAGGVREQDWETIERMLQDSWQSLHEAVEPTGTREANRKAHGAELRVEALGAESM